MPYYGRPAKDTTTIQIARTTHAQLTVLASKMHEETGRERVDYDDVIVDLLRQVEAKEAGR